MHRHPNPPVFTYLTELHDRKMAAGQITGGTATEVLAPGSHPSAASGAGQQLPPHGGSGSASGSEYVEDPLGGAGVVAEVVPGGGGAAAGGGGARKAVTFGGAGAGGGAMPATVELQPSRRRGKKTLGQRVSKAASKASRCYG